MLSIAFYYSSFSTYWHLRCNQGLCTEYVWQEWCALINVPSVLIWNTWVLLAKRWMKWSIGNYLPIPWTWLPKARNVLGLTLTNAWELNHFFLGKGGAFATTHRLPGVSPKIFGRPLTVQERSYVFRQWVNENKGLLLFLFTLTIWSYFSFKFRLQLKNNPYRSS